MVWAQPPPRSLPTQQHRSGHEGATSGGTVSPVPLLPVPEPPGDEEMQLMVNVRRHTCCCS